MRYGAEQKIGCEEMLIVVRNPILSIFGLEVEYYPSYIINKVIV